VPAWGRGVYFGGWGSSSSSSSASSAASGGEGEGEGGERGEGARPPEQGGEEEGEKGVEEVEVEVEAETDIPPVQIEQLATQVLDVFSDAYANKHLLYSVVELIVVRLIPELAEGGVMEVLGERIG